MKSNLWLPLALMSLALAGCTLPHSSVSLSPEATSASSESHRSRPGDGPTDVVRRLARDWSARDARDYALLFADDFQCIAMAGDSAGDAFRERPWLREDEMLMARHLFVGGGALPPARAIDVRLDPRLLASPDPRPGKDPRWHRIVRADADVAIVTARGHGRPEMLRVRGIQSFYVVRGDSAVIPAELIAQGVRPDSAQWWIERWEEQGPLGAPLTWFGVKTRWRD